MGPCGERWQMTRFTTMSIPTTNSNYNTLVKFLLRTYKKHIRTEKRLVRKLEENELPLAQAIYNYITSPNVPKEDKAYRAIATKLKKFQHITHTEIMNLYRSYSEMKGGDTT